VSKLPISLLRDDGSRDQEDAEVTSLAEELLMMEDGSRDNSRSLIPAQDSCEVDSIPEDRGNQGVLSANMPLQYLLSA